MGRARIAALRRRGAAGDGGRGVTPQNNSIATALETLAAALSIKPPKELSEPLRVPLGMPDEFYRRTMLLIFDEMLQGTGDPLRAAGRAAQWWNASVRLRALTPDVIEREFGHVGAEHRLRLAYALLADAPRQADAAAEAISLLDYPSETKSFDVSRGTRASERARAVGIVVEGVRNAFECAKPISLTQAQSIVAEKFRSRTDSAVLNAIGLSKNAFRDVFNKLRAVLPLCEGYDHAINSIDSYNKCREPYQVAFGFAAESFDRLASVRLRQTETPKLFNPEHGLRIAMEGIDARMDATAGR